MEKKYVWMGLSITIIWVVVLFVGLFGPTFEIEGAGEAYGLNIRTQGLAWIVGYFAAIATVFVLVPVTKSRKKVIVPRKRYAWVTLAILVVWLVVLIVALLGLTYEGKSAVQSSHTEPWPVAIPASFFAAVVTVILVRVVVDFGLGESLRRYKEISYDDFGSYGEMM